MGTAYQPKAKQSPYGVIGSLGGMAIAGPPGAAAGGLIGGQADKEAGRQVNVNVPSDSSAIERRLTTTTPQAQDPMAYHQQLMQAAGRLPELSPDEFMQTAPQVVQMLEASKRRLTNGGIT